MVMVDITNKLFSWYYCPICNSEIEAEIEISGHQRYDKERLHDELCMMIGDHMLAKHDEEQEVFAKNQVRVLLKMLLDYCQVSMENDIGACHVTPKRIYDSLVDYIVGNVDPFGNEDSFHFLSDESAMQVIDELSDITGIRRTK